MKTENSLCQGCGRRSINYFHLKCDYCGKDHAEFTDDKTVVGEHNPPKTDENTLIYPIKTIQQIKDESKIRFDEQLKDHALKFAEWIDANGIQGASKGRWIDNAFKYKTTQELYDEFNLTK